jgi:putative acetyltransferase
MGNDAAKPLPTFHIRPETARDHESIRQVNRQAFGQDDEVELVDLLRDGKHVQVSLVAEMRHQIVGHIMFSELDIITPTATIRASALAPMSVLPEFQNQGIGSALVRRGLELCREQGIQIVIVLGHVWYYPRFGFSTSLAAKLDSPFPRDSFMALELVPGALNGITGRVQYSRPFGRWT